MGFNGPVPQPRARVSQFCTPRTPAMASLLSVSRTSGKVSWTFGEDYPLIYTPGRVLLQSERNMEIVKGISNRIEREELIELHRDDAEMFGVQEGDLVEVQTNSTHVRGKAVFHDGIQRGVVSATFLFGQLMVELEASKAPDPMSRVPGLEVASGRLIKLSN